MSTFHACRQRANAGVWPVIFALSVLCCCARSASARDDIVYVEAPADKPGPQRLVGAIADYNGRELRLTNSAGQERKIASAKVVSIVYSKSDAHRQGDEAFRAKDFGSALKRYNSALAGDGEKRAWVRREIATQIVRCSVELQRWERAGELFLLMVGDDPNARHFNAIPLPWLTFQPSPALEQQAMKWLSDTKSPVANLIGASQLLPTNQRGAAVAALQRLQNEKDKRIAALAVAQLWRTKSASAKPDELARWQEYLTEIPADLQAGPLFTYGAALIRHQPAEAALALLRVAILFPQQQQLATRAIEQAAASLENVDAASAELIRQNSKQWLSAGAALPEDTAPQASDDVRFIAGLRQWRLYELAQSYCLSQFQRQDLTLPQRAELTVQLMQTFSEHAAQLPTDERVPLWQAAQQASQEFAQRNAGSEHILLLQTQESITLTNQARLLQQESEVSGKPQKLLEPAQDLIRQAVNTLKELESDISDQIRRRQQGLAGAKDGLSVVQLTNLRTRVQYALGHALVVQGKTYATGSDDRINSLTQAVESLRQVGQLTADDPLTWESRLEETTAHRLIGRGRQALALLKKLRESSPPDSLIPLILAEEIRSHLAQDNVAAALKTIQSVEPNKLQNSGEFDLAQLEAYMAAWRAAKKQQDDQRVAGWEEVAARVVKQMQQRDGPYWARRGEALLATIISQAPVGDAGSLSRSAASFQRAGKYDEALEAYDRAIADAKAAGSGAQAFELSVQAGLIEHAQKHHAEAQRRLREAALAAPKNPKSPDAHLAAIQNVAAWAQQQHSPSLDEYLAMLQEHLENWPDGKTAPQAAWWLAQLLQQQGQWQQAAAAYEKIPKEHPHAAAATSALSVCYDHLLDAQLAEGTPIEKTAAELAGRFEQEIAAGSKPDKWTDSMRGSAMAAARMWLRAGEKGAIQAERVLRSALDGSPDAPPQWRSGAMALLTTSYVQQRRMADAGKMLTQVASGSPDDLVRLLDSLAASPQNTSPDQRRRLAALQLQILKLLGGQTAKLDAAAQLKLKRLEALALIQTGETAKAIAIFDEIVDQLPDDGVVQEEFALLLSQSAEQDQLRAALARWRELERKSRPGSPRWFRANLGLAKAQLALGNKSQARATIKLTQATRPDLGGETVKQEFLELLKRCEENE